MSKETGKCSQIVLPRLVNFSSMLRNMVSMTFAIFLYIQSYTLYCTNLEEEHMQPIRNKEKVKNRFSLVLEFWEAVSGNSKPASFNFCPLPKKIGKYLVWVGRIRTSKARPKLKRCFKKFKCPTFHVSTHSTMTFSGRSSLARRSLKARKLG